MPTLAYVATLNNYTAQDLAILRTPNPDLSYIIIGEEVGASGTKHLQIYFQLAKQKKLTTIKNWGGPWAKMHLEAARGTSDEAATYCMKDGKYHEIGTRTKMGRAGERNDLNCIKKLINEGETYEKIIEGHFETCAKYSKFIKERIQERDCSKQADRLRTLYENTSLKSWQTTLMTNVSGPSDPRKIMWYWDHRGNTGKSFMANYLGLLHGATILTGGRYPDMAYIYSQRPTNMVIFDLSRTTEDYMTAIYSMSEHLKNGRIVSTKYESKTIWTGNPHVIVFANFKPDPNKWSSDRYDVIQLD